MTGMTFTGPFQVDAWSRHAILSHLGMPKRGLEGGNEFAKTPLRLAPVDSTKKPGEPGLFLLMDTDVYLAVWAAFALPAAMAPKVTSRPRTATTAAM
jgi:hypothetical protein